MDADLPLLRVLGLKGMASREVVDGALRSPDSEERLAAAIDAGQARELPRGFALTPEGRELQKAALISECEAVDQSAMAAIYDRFCDLNAEFKALMQRWQIRTVDGEDVPNDHQDADYDAGIVADLSGIDARLSPLVDEVLALVPRLAPVPARFADALEAVRGGETAMMARPLIDSYHTVWFELHEELIALSGRTRAEEAAAGRGD